MSTIYDPPERRATERARVVDALARLAMDPTETPERRLRAQEAVAAAMPPEGGHAIQVAGHTFPVHRSGAGYAMHSQITYEGTGDR